MGAGSRAGSGHWEEVRGGAEWGQGRIKGWVKGRALGRGGAGSGVGHWEGVGGGCGWGWGAGAGSGAGHWEEVRGGAEWGQGRIKGWVKGRALGRGGAGSGAGHWEGGWGKVVSRVG